MATKSGKHSDKGRRAGLQLRVTRASVSLHLGVCSTLQDIAKQKKVSLAWVTGPVNIGNPTEFSMLELAEKVLSLTGSKSTIIFEPLPSDDPKQRQPDISLAKEKLRWSPRVSLEDGLKEAIAYFRKTVM